jgi:hypothetical protein
LSNQEGTDVQFERAAEYFEAHRAGFERVIRLVDECRPARPDSRFSRVFADRPESNSDLICLRPAGHISEIVTELNRNGFVAVDYAVNAERDEADGPIETVEILVFAVGLSVSGRSIAFVYEAAAAPGDVEVVQRENGSVLSERRPITTPPHHWFWEQVS